MKLNIRVHPNSKRNLIQENDDGSLKGYLTASPVDNKANIALIKVVSKHFNIKKSQIEIIKGLKSRNKTIIISEI